VEGRADVINLMKNGISNTVAVEGTHIPRSIVDLTKTEGKRVIAFLDGDRGGDLILRELMQVAKIDYIARAPEGKEVEELTKREIAKALQAKIPADQALALVQDRKAPTPRKRKTTRRAAQASRVSRVKEAEETTATAAGRVAPEAPQTTRRSSGRQIVRQSIDLDDEYVVKVNEIKESFRAVLFDEEKNVIAECGVAELTKQLEELDTVHAIVFDGVVTQRLVDLAAKKGATLIIGAAAADIETRPPGLRYITFEDVERRRG